MGLTALVLAGCEGVPAFSFGSLNIDRERGRIVTQEVTLADGLRVRAPFGKCIDTRRTRQAGANATVVLANCSNLGGRADIGAAIPGIILVTVAPGQHGDIATLSSIIRANPGVLSRSGLAEDVQLISATASASALYVNLVDSSPGGPEGVSARHWKAAVDVAGRAIVISVFGEASGPLIGEAGEDVARDVAQALLEVNAETPAPSATTIIETPVETPENAPQGLLEGLFGPREQ
ncbi:MAG: hypothetical protein AAFP28_12970 [Pseudomonadota bacterium]